MAKRISLKTANEEIAGHIAIHSELKNKAVDLSDTAQQYYGGDILSFVFEKEEVLKLLNANQSINGLRVYYGFNSEAKLPTVVLVPCEITHDTSKDNVINHASNVILSEDDPGLEWPNMIAPTIYTDEFSIANDNF